MPGTTGRGFGRVALVLLVALAADSGIARAETASLLERVKALAGRWEGVAYWSDRPDDRQPVTMTYSLTGRGSAVVENFDPGTGPLMTSVYHADGEDLRMSHFCGAGNQPRLIARPSSDEPDVIRFSFVDATNLGDPPAGHVHAAELEFVGDDRLIVRFVFRIGEGEKVETVELGRADG